MLVPLLLLALAPVSRAEAPPVRFVVSDGRGRVLQAWSDGAPCTTPTAEGLSYALSHRGRAFTVQARCAEGGALALEVHRFDWTDSPLGPKVEIRATVGPAPTVTLPARRPAGRLTVSLSPQP